MRIIGIDPGIAIVGVGIIEYTNNKFKVIDYFAITTTPKNTMPERLEIIYNRLDEILRLYNPDAVAFEELFFNMNAKTALTVGQARGACVLCAQKRKLNIFEYTPLQVKQAVVGYGRADKKQMQQMVKVLLNLNEIPKPDDVADALGIAICHAHSSNFKDMFRIK
ncbi:Crossover junction endodeoxyribonuclease RuvC [Caloramator mitchellensis]|uniref:Crossover junction endodeoxyribonuclease RuvC n=1 Tax=Caloramator mitchellensis TaxID=908809 RepID=A0A0R3JVA9_CALMK|nr:crossover junction endodeoxyribonuclease RuvC [Caloramator mitchellensis]KRQ87511.1 Crossover junction endodeoxyribonuclease RuvC [Caloramator mitchellensis]